MNVYIAAPLSTDEQKFRINKVVKYIRSFEGTDVFVPMEYTVPNAWDMSCLDWGQKVYEHDLEGLEKADVVIAIYDGIVSDSGAAWEIGYARAKKKDIILLCTAVSGKQSLLITGSSAIIREYNEYEKAWNEYITKAYKVI